MDLHDSQVDPETSPLPEVLTEALLYGYTHEEQAARLIPPYFIPAALRPHRDRIMSELRSRVKAEGDPPWVVTRMLVNQRRLDPHFVEQLGRGPFEFGDAACALVACSALSIDEAREIIVSVPTRGGDSLRRQIAMTLRDRGMLDEARAEAGLIGEYSWSAHRDIGWKLAVEGDHEEFFRHWRDYAASKERHGMVLLKTTLVGGVAENHGWQAAVDLALADKRLGEGFRFTAVGRGVDAMSPDQLSEFFAHDARGLLTEQDELSLLVGALVRAAPRNPTSEHPLLASTLDRIIAIDFRVDRATMRSRDGLLSRLWPAMAEEETLTRMRKALRTPSLKREYTVLPRNVITTA
jgi:hypothetical protein